MDTNYHKKTLKEFKAYRYLLPRTTSKVCDMHQAYLMGYRDGKREVNLTTKEEKNIHEVIKAARLIQEYLWGDLNTGAGLEEFKRMFRKRVSKIDAIDIGNPHWKVELKKRCLQTAAICVNLITKIDNDLIDREDNLPELASNLPQYANTIEESDTVWCGCRMPDPDPNSTDECRICGLTIMPF